MEKRQRMWMVFACLLPMINMALFIPRAMYAKTVLRIGMENGPVQIPSWLVTAYDLRLYLRFATGICLCLWAILLVRALTKRKAQLGAGIFSFVICLVVFICIRYDISYFEAMLLDNMIWLSFTFCMVVYLFLPLSHKQA